MRIIIVTPQVMNALMLLGVLWLGYLGFVFVWHAG